MLLDIDFCLCNLPEEWTPLLINLSCGVLMMVVRNARYSKLQGPKHMIHIIFINFKSACEPWLEASVLLPYREHSFSALISFFSSKLIHILYVLTTLARLNAWPRILNQNVATSSQTSKFVVCNRPVFCLFFSLCLSCAASKQVRKDYFLFCKSFKRSLNVSPSIKM